MSTGASTGAGGFAGAIGKPGKEPSTATRARQGAILQVAKEGTPAEVTELLVRLVASGDIILNDESHGDVGLPEEELLELDSELDLSDEDEFRSDWQDDDASGYGDHEPISDIRDMDPSEPEHTFAILVSKDGSCTVPADEWSLYCPLTKHGADTLEELGKRFLALKKVATWLTAERKQFLLEQDPWWLGMRALEEAGRGIAPVLESTIIKQLGLNVDKSTFSRYTRSTSLEWADGDCSLSILISEDAKCAWVANAVMQFVRHGGEKLNSDIIAEARSVTAPKDVEAKERLKGVLVEEMDFYQFVQYANMLADTKWTNVVERCGERMCS